MATALEKLAVLPAVGLILGKTVAAAVTGLFTGTYGAPSYGEYVTNSGMRAFLSTFSSQQIQWILPEFPATYETWCRTKKVKPDMVKITTPAGTSVAGLWVGDKAKAKYHMVYYHGGGWAMPGSDAHLNLLEKFVKWSGDKLAILAIDYSLSPKAVYPMALSECVEGLRHVLDVQGCPPSKVLLGGDSAGAGLVLSVLAHLNHPHPNTAVVKPLKVSAPLYGAIALDPWISTDIARYPSFTTYQYRDNFPLAGLKYWAANYEGGAPTDDNYMWPAQADAAWWSGTPCQRMLATVGEHEILSDCVKDWARKYGEAVGEKKVELVVGKEETHIRVILSPRTEMQLLAPDEEGQEKAIMKWFKRVFA